MELIDSHCHLDDYEDLPDVLRRAKEAGVGTLLAIGIGDGPETMHRALEIANASDGGGPEIWASVGIHPQEAAHATPEALAKLAALAEEPRCVAVGEIGLDYYHVDNPDVPTQQAAFVAQMSVAAALGKPILIHCRTSELAKPEAKERFGEADAWEDLLALIAEHWTPHGLPGVMHCFSGTVEQGRRSLEAGFYLSFAGNLTYPRSVSIREAAAMAPADCILVETDAPFLAPIPHRGQRNEPALVTHTAAALAELRGISSEEVARLTSENFNRLFRLASLR
ncbi:TatD family hydrolase [Granulicella arctica]|uniref:TatD DNase family protein n=1 Tax=Granulicella arctica TaxID=940613 RepID=A0A7Y9PH79_9BACT|nr:TatD family hydrolase [Granulicella arctica]NYF79801.1 TatD DNase family protein [Granulicella arctica]